jgi:hypothetical protein
MTCLHFPHSSNDTASRDHHQIFFSHLSSFLSPLSSSSLSQSIHPKVNRVMQGKEPTDLDIGTAREFYNSKGAGTNVFFLDKYHHSACKLVVIGDAAHTMSSALGQVGHLSVSLYVSVSVFVSALKSLYVLRCLLLCISFEKIIAS